MTQRDVSSWLPNLLGPLDLRLNSAETDVPRRSTINLIGDVSIEDDPDNEATNLYLTASTVLANSSTGSIHDVVSTDETGPVSALRMAGAAPTITGIASGTSGRKLVVMATGGAVVLANENAGSVAANRIVTGTGANVTVANGSAALLCYDATSSRWRLVGDGAGGGGGSVPTGTGFRHVTSGAEDAASKKVDLTDAADITLPGADTYVLYRDGSVVNAESDLAFNKTTNVLTAAGGLAVGTSGFLSIPGANPAASAGGLRLGIGVFVRCRNNANSADLDILSVNSSDQMVLGATTGVTAWFITSVTTGTIRSATINLTNTGGSNTRGTINDNGWQFFGGTTDFGGGVKVMGLDDSTTQPSTNPTGGGILYSDAGAGKWRGSGGTVTTFGPADPHCPSCGRDFALEWVNDTYAEELAVCVPCLVYALSGAGVDVGAFTIRKDLAA